MKLPRILLVCCALLPGVPSVSARAADVRDVRLWAGPDNTRVVLDLTGSARHSMRALHHPDRIVLDLPGVGVRPGAHAGATGAVRGLRFTHRAGGGLRIVIDLTHAVRADSFLTAPNDRYGYRLVVDLAGGSPGLPRTATVRPNTATVRPNTARPSSPPPAVAAAVAVKPEHAPAAARDLIVAIDAGHGGDDPGAIGKNGTREKDIVLAIARELYNRVNGEAGMRAVLTRDGDYFIPLRERMQRARARQADLFVSIHADSVVDRHVDGSSVYILSQRGASDEAARWLAERENASDLIGGVSLDDKDDVLASVLLDLSQSAALSASETAAESVLHELTQVGEVRKPQVQQARFMVLKSPDIPSMLVETAYISNPEEERRLREHAHQAKLAEAIHQGIHDYFYANPPPGTHVAQLVAGASQRTVPTGLMAGGH
jgi:N-acetylmuramoyl-L-alanine amidase